MKHATSNIALGVVLAVTGSLAQTALLQSQESWGGQGGASSWQARAAKATGASAGSIARGGESSWGAGKGSVVTHSAPGGVWSDGITSHDAAVQALGPKTTAGVTSLSKPVGLTNLGAAPSRSHIAATGPKGKTGPQFGLSKSGGISHRISGSGHGAIIMRGHSGASSHNSSTTRGEGLESPMQSDPAMSGLAGSTSNSTLSLEPHSSLDSSSH